MSFTNFNIFIIVINRFTLNSSKSVDYLMCKALLYTFWSFFNLFLVLCISWADLRKIYKAHAYQLDHLGSNRWPQQRPLIKPQSLFFSVSCIQEHRLLKWLPLSFKLIHFYRHRDLYVRVQKFSKLRSMEMSFSKGEETSTVALEAQRSTHL